MKNALCELLNCLDQIAIKHEEIHDTAVREEMGFAIYQSFVMQTHDFELPHFYAMFSDEGNEQIYSALLRFLGHSDVISANAQLRFPGERFAAVQDDDAKSTRGSTYMDFFGHVDIV